MTTPGNRTPRKPQLNLTVRSREELSPSMVRVVLGLDEPERYEDIAPPEKYVKLVFLDPAVPPPSPADAPSPDYWELRESLPPDPQPVTRHLTVRRYVPERHELWMDVVLHGDEGFAGPWAARAGPETGSSPSARAARGPLIPAPRAELFARRGLERAQVSLSGYWARGRTEDVFQAEKRLPVGRIL